ncbi:hypothetical protein NDU88_004219 [Pleurodeles waltl]|uniref:Uncharacterized protein n=1 Tax=Pleurodeles waltl TaxID=8319 RepID=A0AAV7TRZ8_PLEWA|nr:hypothetical protein NDU88_004219 [Pleurodeles waltl]
MKDTPTYYRFLSLLRSVTNYIVFNMKHAVVVNAPLSVSVYGWYKKYGGGLAEAARWSSFAVQQYFDQGEPGVTRCGLGKRYPPATVNYRGVRESRNREDEPMQMAGGNMIALDGGLLPTR